MTVRVAFGADDDNECVAAVAIECVEAFLGVGEFDEEERPNIDAVRSL